MKKKSQTTKRKEAREKYKNVTFRTILLSLRESSEQIAWSSSADEQLLGMSTDLSVTGGLWPSVDTKYKVFSHRISKALKLPDILLLVINELQNRDINTHHRHK